MFLFILGLFFGLLAVYFQILFRAYRAVPSKELKRRARTGDQTAGLLYKVSTYGISSDVIIAALGLVALYIGFICLDKSVSVYLAVPVLLVLAVLGEYFVRSHGSTHLAVDWLAKKSAPALSWLVERLLPLFDWMGRLVRRVLPVQLHSGLYEKQDIIDLLERQKHQPDNRIPKAEIDLLTNALSFGDKLVADAMTPKRVVVTADAESSVGPILMSDLHKTGHSRFPVFEGKHDNIVGVLYLHDLIEVKQTGTVKKVMRPKVMYVHEDFSLFQTLQAFVKTKQHLFIVVNEFEEYVGIITIEDVLERVIGRLIVDEFDRYEDLRAVAEAAALKDHATNKKNHAETVEAATKDGSEVVK